MNLMPLIVIGREACLCVRGPLRLSKDPGPKRRPNIGKEGKVKGNTWEFLKVGDGGVQCNR